MPRTKQNVYVGAYENTSMPMHPKRGTIRPREVPVTTKGKYSNTTKQYNFLYTSGQHRSSVLPCKNKRFIIQESPDQPIICTMVSMGRVNPALLTEADFWSREQR